MIDPRVQETALQQATDQGKGIMPFTSGETLDKIEKDQYRKDAEAKQSKPEIINLAAHIRKVWTRNRTAKMPVEEVMLNSLLQRDGKYDSVSLARIKQSGGSEIFFNITDPVCRSFEAWMEDAILPAGERPFAVEPTPLPDLSDDIEQELSVRLQGEYQQAISQAVMMGTIDPNEIPQMLEQMKADIQEATREIAEKEAKEFETLIDDEIREGGWYESLRKVIPDISTLKAGIIHGPEVYRKKTLTWNTYPDGKPYATVEFKPLRQYRRVNPFDLYPSPGATSFDDGDLIERMRLSRSDLLAYIGSGNGFDDDAIRSVLEMYGRGGLREWATNDLQREEAEGRPSTAGTANEDEKIDCLKFMGRVQGVMLLQWGMGPDKVADPLQDYEVIAYLIGQYVIKAKLNEDPLDKRNYWSTSFKKSNDSPWGRSIPEIMESQQRICNGAARAIVNNMSHASGPVTWFRGDQINGPLPTRIHPWMTLNFKTRDVADSQAPIGFFQAQIIVEQLLKIFDFYSNQASETTGIPKYTYGSQESTTGAAGTASGLSMLMNNAAKGLKRVASNIDTDIIKPSVYAHWLHIMLYEPEKAKGDINIAARASEYLLQQEQLQVRRNEWLMATNNPTDLAIIQPEGRAEVLRETVRGLKMPVDRIVPDRKKLAELKQENEMSGVFQNISTALGIPVEQVAQIATGQAPQEQPGKPEAKALLPNGQPAGGKEANLVQ